MRWKTATRRSTAQPDLRDARGHPQALFAPQRRAARGASRAGGAALFAGQQPSLEAQLCNLADEIAYNAHDIDDGVRSGLITLEQLQRGAAVRAATAPRRRRTHCPAVGRPRPASAIERGDTRDAQRPGVRRDRRHARGPGRTAPAWTPCAPGCRRWCGSRPPCAQSRQLKKVLRRALSYTPGGADHRWRARQVVRELFALHQADPQPDAGGPGRSRPGGRRCQRARTVADFIAGMTDRPPALRQPLHPRGEHERLPGQRLLAVGGEARHTMPCPRSEPAAMTTCTRSTQPRRPRRCRWWCRTPCAGWSRRHRLNLARLPRAAHQGQIHCKW